MQQQGALLHTGQRGDGGVAHAVVTQLGVDFIRQHKDVMLHTYLRNAVERLQGRDGARGIGGEVEHEHLGARRDGRLQLVRVQGKEVLDAGLNGHGHAVRHLYGGGVAHIHRLVVNHLVPGVQQAAQGQVDGLADADGGENLAGGVIAHAEERGHIGSDGLAQGEQAVVAGVGGVPFLQGEDGGLPDVPGGHEIGLADAQGDDVLAAGAEVEELADAGARHIHDLAREETLHVHGWERGKIRERR